MRKSVAIVLGITLAGLAVRLRIVANASAGSGDGVVVGIVGDWTPVDPSSGEPVGKPPLDFLKPVGKYSCARGTGGTLTVKFDLDDGVYAFPCGSKRDDGPCHLPQYPPPGVICVRWIQPPAERSLGQRFLDAVNPLLGRSSERFIAPVSRGLEAEFADVVVPRRGANVEISEAFQDLPEGNYRVRLTRLPSSTNSAETIQTSVHWQGSGNAAIPALDARPGLYRIVQLDAQGQERGSDGWLLIVSEERFAETSRRFHEARICS